MSKFTKCDNLFRALLKAKRGLRCEICGKPQERLSHPLSVFHILNKGSHPRLRYSEANTLLACWTKGDSRACHNVWHMSGHGDWVDERREWIKSKICALRGCKDWDELRAHLSLIERMTGKVDLKMTEIALQSALEQLKKGKA